MRRAVFGLLLVAGMMASGCAALFPGPNSWGPSVRESRRGRATRTSREDLAEQQHLMLSNHYRAATGLRTFNHRGRDTALTWATQFYRNGPYVFSFTRYTVEALQARDARGAMRYPGAALLLPFALVMDVFGLPVEIIFDFFRWLIGPPSDMSVRGYYRRRP